MFTIAAAMPVRSVYECNKDNMLIFSTRSHNDKQSIWVWLKCHNLKLRN